VFRYHTTRDISALPQWVFDGVNLLQAEITDFEDIFWKIKPDFVINAIGYVKQRNENRDLAIELNTVLPRRLSALSKSCGFRLFHISTDCVYNGEENAVYWDENAYTQLTEENHARDLYGITKSLGEIGNCLNTMTIRTSIVGREIYHFTGLMEWFFEQFYTRDYCSGFRTHIYSGLTTTELSKRVLSIVLGKMRFVSGIHQLASEPIDKAALLSKFVMHLTSRPFLPFRVVQTFPDAVFRVLKHNEAVFGERPTWHEMLMEIREEMPLYNAWRFGK
jgi:dTDP-4-dehydrorhamnose reductase